MKYIFLTLIIVASGCKMDSDKKVDRNKFTYKTGDDTELFFKNIRQSEYDFEENKAAKFNLFRYEDRVTTQETPVLNLAIVINYMKDEAYLLVEPNDILDNEEVISVTVKDSDLTFELSAFNHQSMLEFASQIYEQLLLDKNFVVMVNGEQTPVLNTLDEREAFRITMSDYYRLVRVY
ncbi:hypothetical protein E1176_15710 [Fulvivirga sp. RKSG066]|uniref:hypothetical protein n=1 Tax=Fulvivirga aurantia TaxID=2529383 RepID=UPI0012BD6D23|nr:hypothetical protein [Fulvivirga aurantia]MTI22478.1 hypothetical protein [Fulvivirga aurantia]